MIGRLKGSIVELEKDKLIVDVQGVGYEVAASADLIGSMEVGAEVNLSIYTDVRENSISLFGFREISEKNLFLLLKKVKGIGSKLSLTIVSCVGTANLLRAISLEDVTSLQKVPGVGKKSAERIIIELRERVDELIGTPGNHNNSLASKIEIRLTSSVRDDAVVALERLGFSRPHADSAVQSAIAENPGIEKENASALLRLALSKVG